MERAPLSEYVVYLANKQKSIVRADKTCLGRDRGEGQNSVLPPRMETGLASTMRKDSKCRMISEEGGELSLKHTVDTRSMKKALHCFLNQACWLIRILDKKRDKELQFITGQIHTACHYLDLMKEHIAAESTSKDLGCF